MLGPFHTHARSYHEIKDLSYTVVAVYVTSILLDTLLLPWSFLAIVRALTRHYNIGGTHITIITVFSFHAMEEIK